MRSNLSINVWTLALSALLAGCARSAPNLPADYQGDRAALDRAMTKVPANVLALNCGQINQEIERLAENDSALDRQIQSNRGQNQVAGYIAGVFFLPAILAVDSDSGTKNLLDQNQLYRDNLVVAFRGKKCPVTRGDFK